MSLSECNFGGPKVVAIGGGHGLARTLVAARNYASQLTAIVSVADNGGSSGKLRSSLGIPAPGDIRRCIGALASQHSLLGNTLEHRFIGGDLDHHAFGNILLAALSATTGSFMEAVEEASRLVGAVGRVFPATLVPVTLHGESGDGRHIAGQVENMGWPGRRIVSLQPDDAPVPRDALVGIGEADQIIIGPGSLYTSLLAAIVAGEIRNALATASGRIVLVANLSEQAKETTGFDTADHLRAFGDHGVRIDAVLVNSNDESNASAFSQRPTWVPDGVEFIAAKVCQDGAVVHDANYLGAALASLT